MLSGAVFILPTGRPPLVPGGLFVSRRLVLRQIGWLVLSILLFFLVYIFPLMTLFQGMIWFLTITTRNHSNIFLLFLISILRIFISCLTWFYGQAMSSLMIGTTTYKTISRWSSIDWRCKGITGLIFLFWPVFIYVLIYIPLSISRCFFF